jgi:hypothetical protein
MLLALEDFINKNSMRITERRRKPGRRQSLKLEATLTKMETQYKKSLRLTVLKDSEWTLPMRMVPDTLELFSWALTMLQ